MTRPALDDLEKRELATRLTSAFARYARLKRGIALAPLPQETAQDAAVRVQRYGEELSKVVLGEVELKQAIDLPKLVHDVYSLLKKGCPELDLVELSLVCTSGLNFSPRHVFDVFGFSEQTLTHMRDGARRLSRQLGLLNRLPVVHLTSSLHEMKMPHRKRSHLKRGIAQIPDLLSAVADLLDHQIEHLEPGLTSEAVLESIQLIYFSLLLKPFGIGYPTLSGILKLLREIRQRVRPIPPYVMQLDPISINSRRVRDPLSSMAIQRFVCRFFEDCDQHDEMQNDVCCYLTCQYDSHRQRGETLLSLLSILPAFEPDREPRTVLPPAPGTQHSV